jgi:hypothetical protein
MDLTLEDAKKMISELEKKLTDITGQFEKVKANNEELVNEKRKESDKRREIEAKKKEDEERLARETGDAQAIIKALEEKNQDLVQKYEKANQTIQEYTTKDQKREISSVASKLASEIAYDNHSAELLSDFISRRLKFSEDGVKVTNEKGELTVSTIDELKKEFVETPKYSALVKGTQASGGRPTQPTGSPGKNNQSKNENIVPAVEKLHRAHESNNKNA